MDKQKVAVFGGSFSCVPASQVAKKAWSQAFGVEVVDFGIGGTGFVTGAEAHNDVPNQICRALASGNRFCAFIFWASTNDIWRTVEEQNAAIERCVAKIRKESPDSAVLLFASMPVPLDSAKNALLGRLVEGQIATCARLGVPCLDLYHRSAGRPAGCRRRRGNSWQTPSGAAASARGPSSQDNKRLRNTRSI